jgi:hypothetical protein
MPVMIDERIKATIGVTLLQGARADRNNLSDHMKDSVAQI